MSKPEALPKILKVSKYIFWISLAVFFISISYNKGYSTGELAGSAGTGGEVTPPIGIPDNASPNGDLIAIISGVGVGLGGISQFLAPWLTERARYKTAQIQNEMQMREIEKLRLELGLEEKEKKSTKKKVKTKK